MALYHTASNQIYRSIGNIQNLLDRFGNEVTVISLDGYNAEIQGVSAEQSTFVLEILRCYTSAAEFLNWQSEKITEQEHTIVGEKEQFNTALQKQESSYAVAEQRFYAALESNERDKVAFEEKCNDVLKLQERLITQKDQQLAIVIANKQEIKTILENQIQDFRSGIEPLLKGLGQPHAKGLHKYGSISRTNAWKGLSLHNRVRVGEKIPRQTQKDVRGTLHEALLEHSSKWSRERDMYEDIVNAMKILHPDNVESSSTGNPILVQGTFQSAYFRADISVASQFNQSLPSTILYFVELKGLITNNPKAAEHCGQILDYFNDLHKAQVNRKKFVAVLSNCRSSWVFEACYEGRDVTITERSAIDLADALVYADILSRQQYNENRVPALDETCFVKKSVIMLREKHTLLSVERLQVQNISEEDTDTMWLDPFKPREGSNVFVLKVKAPEGTSEALADEIRILQEIRIKLMYHQEFLHVPQLVWTAQDQLGIMPYGRPIDLDNGEPASISRKIVHGLMDGLRFLHQMEIIHRDICLSNLVLAGAHAECHVVIIDYENAVNNDGKDSSSYRGGTISQPRHLLKEHFAHLVSGFSNGNDSCPSYIPTKADDLEAAILVVLHILFPQLFGQFLGKELKDTKAQADHIKDILDLWDNIASSEIWNPYLEAAKILDYTKLKKMAAVFCAPRV